MAREKDMRLIHCPKRGANVYRWICFESCKYTTDDCPKSPRGTESKLRRTK